MLVRIENIIGDHNDELSSILLSSESIDALSRILGETPILFKDKINYKLPGCREDKLHQDQAAGWGQYCDFFVTMVVAVDENRRENAAMAVLKTGNYERRLMTEEWQPLAGGESPFESLTDAFGVITGTSFDQMNPKGSTNTVDLGTVA